MSAAQEYIPVNIESDATNNYAPGFAPDRLLLKKHTRYTAGGAGRANAKDIQNVNGIYEGLDTSLFCCDQQCRSEAPKFCRLATSSKEDPVPCNFPPANVGSMRRARARGDGERARDLVRRLSELGVEEKGKLKRAHEEILRGLRRE